MNIKAKIQFFQPHVKLLFPVCMFLCLLLFFILPRIHDVAEASSIVTPSNHTTFSQSYRITDNIVISADIAPPYPAHYYYLELDMPASVSLQFTHAKEGHFQFLFQSLDEHIKYTAKTRKSSYNWTIENLAAGRYYLTVSCSFHTCTEEQYTLSCSYNPLPQTTPTPVPANSPADNQTGSSGTDKDINSTKPDNTTDKNSSLSENKKGRNTKKSKKKKKILMRSLQLKNRKKYLYISHSMKLKPKILPKNTTNQSLRFFSSDTSIARVSKQGCVKALKNGNVTITVKSVDGSHLYATYFLKIKNQKTSGTDISTPSSPEPPLLPDTDEENKSDTPMVSASSIQLSATALTLRVKKSAQIQASVFPSNAENKKLHWKSLNPKTATVRNGKVTANAPGITTIIVSLKSNPSIRASCTITVT